MKAIYDAGKDGVGLASVTPTLTCLTFARRIWVDCEPHRAGKVSGSMLTKVLGKSGLSLCHRD